MFSFSTISSYHEYLKQTSNGCEIAITYYLDKIEKNSHLNAFTEIYSEEAIAKAQELDAKRNSGATPGKLHGVVVALKDVICYKNHKVTAASRMLEGFTSLFNASAVQFLLDEEAIIIGTCNCDEFAMGSSNENSCYGPVLHPLDNSKVPGGSSGGSAVAVSAGMCMVSLGSDTGGSVRQPADFCGILGIKPGYGKISRHGLIAYASSFDQIGIFGKNTDDIERVLEVISRPDEFDSTMNPSHADDQPPKYKHPETSTYRIAVFKEVMQHHSLDPEIARSIQSTLDQLKTEGHHITELEFDHLEYIVPTYYVLTAAEASSNLSRYDGVRYGHQSNGKPSGLQEFYTNNRTEGFGKEVKRRIMLGNFVLSSGYYDAYYTKAQQVRGLLKEQTDSIFREHDFLLMPVSPTTAFSLNEKKDPVSMYLADIFTVFANLTGLPSIAVPLYRHSNGLPFGLQLLCGSGMEQTLLAFSGRLMKSRHP